MKEFINRIILKFKTDVLPLIKDFFIVIIPSDKTETSLLVAIFVLYSFQFIFIGFWFSIYYFLATIIAYVVYKYKIRSKMAEFHRMQSADDFANTKKPKK